MKPVFSRSTLHVKFHGCSWPWPGPANCDLCAECAIKCDTTPAHIQMTFVFSSFPAPGSISGEQATRRTHQLRRLQGYPPLYNSPEKSLEKAFVAAGPWLTIFSIGNLHEHALEVRCTVTSSRCCICDHANMCGK